MLNFLLTSVVWNTNYENNPENSDGPNFGAAEMRSDRKAVRERLEKEHTMNLLSGVVANDGYHKPGSSKDYYQADAPTLRPDGVTALTADDNGRKWVRSTDKRLYVYVHPDWVTLSTINTNDNTFSGNNTFTGQVTGAVNIEANSPLHAGEKVKFKVFQVTIPTNKTSDSVDHGITDAFTNHRILSASVSSPLNAGTMAFDYLLEDVYYTDTKLTVKLSDWPPVTQVRKVFIQYV